MAFGRKGKGKGDGDIWERSFGVPEAPSEQEKLERSRIYKAAKKVDGIEDPRERARAYKRLSVATLAVCAAVLVAAMLFAPTVGDGGDGQEAASGASSGQASSTASDPSKRFSEVGDLTWLPAADKEELLTQLSAYLDAFGYEEGSRARVYGFHEQASGATVVYATVDKDAQCVSCALKDGKWEFTKCVVPTGLEDYLKGLQAEKEKAADEKAAEKKAAAAGTSGQASTESVIKGSDTASLSRYLPSEAALRLADDFAEYMSVKKHPIDKSTVVVRESTASVNAAGNAVLEVGAKAENGDTVFAEAEWRPADSEFGFTIQ